MTAANKVFYNTAITYLRMIVTVGFSLYTTRLVLLGLGEEDYGIYNLIAGIIILLSFLNVAMSTSTQRYLSFYQGKGELNLLKKIFANSMILHIIIGLFVVAIIELSGLLMFDTILNISPDKISTAKNLYHLMCVTVFLTVISVPFSALLNAHEDMVWISIINVVEVILKLLIALALLFLKNDKLLFYGLSMASVSLISLIMYFYLCRYKYDECTFNFRKFKNKKLIKELTKFAGWNLFGSLCSLGKSQGVAVILNIFLGTIANAAYGIANQVSGQMNFFSASLLRAINPQIMKSEGAGNRERMLRLSMMASKFGFFLLAIVAIPCMFEMPIILKLWLKNVPDYTVMFCNMMLLSTLVNQLTIGFQSAIQATGNIKKYQIVVGTILLLNLPLSYVLLRIGLTPFYVFFSFVITEFIACFFRLLFLYKIAGLSIKNFYKRVILKEALPILSTVLVCLFITNFFTFKFRFLVTILLSIIVLSVNVICFGLCKDEKEILYTLLKKIKKTLAKIM